MVVSMKIRSAALTLVISVLGFAFPPGAPMSEFGPAQVSLGAFFDHSGQDLFIDSYPSVLNSTGLSLDYAPWTFIQMGIFGGAGELDVAIPESRSTDTSARAFNTNYKPYGGISGRLATPRFASGTMRAVAFGTAAALESSDKFGNSKTPFVFSGGASLQFMVWNKLNFVLGSEYYAWIGEQISARGNVEPFGLSEPSGPVDHIRGLIGVEYFFKGLNRPFISVAFRPSSLLGWDDKLGLRNGSISISLGAMATIGKARVAAGDDEPSLLDE
jgi:hypothetical protein